MSVAAKCEPLTREVKLLVAFWAKYLKVGEEIICTEGRCDKPFLACLEDLFTIHQRYRGFYLWYYLQSMLLEVELILLLWENLVDLDNIRDTVDLRDTEAIYELHRLVGKDPLYIVVEKPCFQTIRPRCDYYLFLCVLPQVGQLVSDHHPGRLFLSRWNRVLHVGYN